MRLTDTDREIHSLMFRDIDKPDRVRALWQLKSTLSPYGYWKLFRDVWTGSESLFYHDYFYGQMFRQYPSCSGLFMNQAERTRLKHLDNSLTVYRGGSAINRDGWSWTLELGTAQFFGRRAATDDTAYVYTATVEKEHVKGLMMGRNEDELVINPRKPLILKQHAIPAQDMNANRHMFWAVQTGNMDIPMVIPKGDELRFEKMVDEKVERLQRFGLADLVDKERARFDAAHIVPVGGMPVDV